MAFPVVFNQKTETAIYQKVAASQPFAATCRIISGVAVPIRSGRKRPANPRFKNFPPVRLAFRGWLLGGKTMIIPTKANTFGMIERLFLRFHAEMAPLTAKTQYLTAQLQNFLSLTSEVGFCHFILGLSIKFLFVVLAPAIRFPFSQTPGAGYAGPWPQRKRGK
jgi:hypothetical protein